MRYQNFTEQELADIADIKKQFVADNTLSKMANKQGQAWVGEHDNALIELVETRLGWIDILPWVEQQLDGIEAFIKTLEHDEISHCVLLGMGGSSLAPEVLLTLQQNLGLKKRLTFEVLDDTSAEKITQIDQRIDYKKTLFIVASKSGATLESDAFYRYFYAKYSPQQAGQHFIAITDPDTHLHQSAQKNNFRHIFVNPSDIGGRYSALSLFGIVPAAIMGLDCHKIISSAEKEYQQIFSHQDSAPAIDLGIALAVLAKKGVNKLAISYPPELNHIGLWIEQLVAESTGKKGKGVVPILDQRSIHLNNEDIIHVRINDDTSTGNNHQIHWTIDIPDNEFTHDIGREFYRWEMAVAVAGIVLQINPFDEPNVSEAKAKTNAVLQDKALLETVGIDGCFNIEQQQDDVVLALKDIIRAIHADQYLGFLIYGSAKNAVREHLEPLIERVVDNHNIPVSWNIGPRYLHSSGQLHKGGPKQGVFIVVHLDDPCGLKIPGKDFTFDELNFAQALGDFQVLIDKGLSALMLYSHHRKASIEKLTTIVNDVLKTDN